jgi:hypothetical protein
MISKKLRDQFKPAKRQTKAPIDGLGNPIDPSTRYFLQNARRGSAVGKCALWWRSACDGCTCDLEQAGIFLGTEVKILRNTDIPWPEAHVRSITVTHVLADNQALQPRDPASRADDPQRAPAPQSRRNPDQPT